MTFIGLAGVPAPPVWVASAGCINFGAGVGITTGGGQLNTGLVNLTSAPVVSEP